MGTLLRGLLSTMQVRYDLPRRNSMTVLVNFISVLVRRLVPVLTASAGVFAAFSPCFAGDSPRGMVQDVVFRSGDEGYHTFRIPSLIVTPKGTVLAFCEGRKNGTSDTGDIDLILKRSTDGGATWKPLQVVADHGPDTIGNPCPVIDRASG